MVFHLPRIKTSRGAWIWQSTDSRECWKFTPGFWFALTNNNITVSAHFLVANSYYKHPVPPLSKLCFQLEIWGLSVKILSCSWSLLEMMSASWHCPAGRRCFTKSRHRPSQQKKKKKTIDRLQWSGKETFPKPASLSCTADARQDDQWTHVAYAKTWTFCQHVTTLLSHFSAIRVLWPHPHCRFIWFLLTVRSWTWHGLLAHLLQSSMSSSMSFCMTCTELLFTFSWLVFGWIVSLYLEVLPFSCDLQP